jgi:hypothetical protein
LIAYLPALLTSSLFLLSFFPFRSISPQGLKEHFLTVAALVLAGEGPEQGLAQDFFVGSTWLRWGSACVQGCVLLAVSA